MNWLDIALITICLVGFCYGIARGILRMLTSFVSLLLALYCAQLYYSMVRELVLRVIPGINGGLASALGYTVVFFVTLVSVELVGRALAGIVKSVHLAWLDRIGGAIFGIAVTGVLLGLILMLATAFLPANSPALRDSLLAPRLLYSTEILIGLIPSQLKELYERKRDSLIGYWTQHANSFVVPSPKSSPSALASPTP